MSYDRLDDEDMPGYFLPEESQFRLARLSDHVRFLARMAQPRTQAEERAAEPKVRMGELAFCLELLADQVDLVLDEVSYPAQRTGKTGVTRSDAIAEVTQAAGGGFRVTLEQIDRLNLLVETVSAHARVVAVGDASKRAGKTPPEMGDVIFDAVAEVRTLLTQIESQPLRHALPKSDVREERAVYAVGRVSQAVGGERLH
ncbi:XAC0095 family protein [Xanthomonas sacchari]